MAELTYRDAVARGIAQEMTRDPDVIFFGEDVAKAGGVFKATVGLYEKFGPMRVRDTPISEQAILGAAMGAAMTGLRPIAERLGITMGQLALAWNIAQPGVTAAIAGSRSGEHMRQNADAGDLALDAATIAEVETLLAG